MRTLLQSIGSLAGRYAFNVGKLKTHMASRVAAVLFDFWNTLFVPQVDSSTYWKFRAKYVKETLEALGFSYDNEEVLAVLRNARKLCDAIRKYEGREISVYGEVAAGLILLGVEELDREIVKKVARSYARPFLEFLRPDRDSKLVLSELKKRGLKLGLVSNTMFSWANRELLEKYSLKGYFDTLVFSDEVGYSKPNPLIFERALSELRVSARNTIMVGDEPADVLGAKALGIRPILIARNAFAESLMKDIIVIRSLKEILHHITCLRP